MRATVRAGSLRSFSPAMRFNLLRTSRGSRRLEGRQGAGPALKSSGTIVVHWRLIDLAQWIFEDAWIRSIFFSSSGGQEQLCRDMRSSQSNFRFSETSGHIAVTAAIEFDTLALGRDHQ